MMREEGQEGLTCRSIHKVVLPPLVLILLVMLQSPLCAQPLGERWADLVSVEQELLAQLEMHCSAEVLFEGL